jgi:hypothetical protein
VIREARASAPVLELDGFRWRPALPSDAGVLDRLAGHGTNRMLFRLPASEPDFVIALNRPGFRLPFLCLRGSDPVGAAATALRNQRSLNLRLIAFFAEPAAATLPIAMYLRHIFWTLPMHRVYIQLPIVAGSEDYRRSLGEAGFQEEGVVRGHGIVGGNECDVVALGLLRAEFEAWCQQNESRLNL